MESLVFHFFPFLLPSQFEGLKGFSEQTKAEFHGM